jgi:hypothetical protein
MRLVPQLHQIPAPATSILAQRLAKIKTAAQGALPFPSRLSQED